MMRKQHTLILLFVITITCAINMSCGKSNDETASNSLTADYEYVFLEVGEQKFIQPAEQFAGGAGTEEDPYKISNAAELALLGQIYEIEAETDPGDERVAPYYKAYYILTDDIVINEVADGEDWSDITPEYAWLPIGFHSGFHGVFDGDGHTVSGLYIYTNYSERNDTSTGNSYGLFGINYGTIKNINLDKAYICVGGYSSDVGGIAGTSSLADNSIVNCNVNADIYCYNAECGGVVGTNKGIVSDCSFSGTVNALQEQWIHSTGGIVGYNTGSISRCTNNGVITCVSANGSVGGIAGTHNDNEIRECKNNGICSGGDDVGGIVGDVFLSSIGGEFMSKRADIIDCINSAFVSTNGSNAGGITGNCMLDDSEYKITISGCNNSGIIMATGKTGGIIGLVSLCGKGGVTISNCNNSADLGGEVSSGIIGTANDMFGTMIISDCYNSGQITAELYGAGIVAENNLMAWNDDKEDPLNVTISGCKNTGTVTTMRGGGVAGVFVSTIPAEYGNRVTVILENDVNNADIHCTSDNGFVGGIAGNLGVMNGNILVKDSYASGVISYPELNIDEETVGITVKEIRPELSRIGGGILGMVDTGIFFSTNNDGMDESQVNNPDAKTIITGCHSDMSFIAPEENEYVYTDDGTPVYMNYFGGIIGFYSDKTGLAFLVEDSTYSGCNRGLGKTSLPDVGMRQ